MGRRRQDSGAIQILTRLTELVSEGVSDEVAGKRLGLTRHQVRYLRRQFEIVPQPKKRAPAPDGFPAIASQRSLNETAKHYKVAWKTARRWAQETGTVTGTSLHLRNALRRHQRRSQEQRAAPDQHEQAAHYLRRFVQVYRADILLFVGKLDTVGSKLGLPGRGRGWWMVDGKPMQRDELMAAAVAKGFKA